MERQNWQRVKSREDKEVLTEKEKEGRTGNRQGRGRRSLCMSTTKVARRPSKMGMQSRKRKGTARNFPGAEMGLERIPENSRGTRRRKRRRRKQLKDNDEGMPCIQFAKQ